MPPGPRKRPAAHDRIHVPVCPLDAIFAGPGDERQARAGPGGYAAFEVLGLEAARPQGFRGAVAPRTATADRDDDTILRDLADASSELAERDVLRAIDVAGVPFVLLSHVEKVQLGTPLADILWQHTTILAHGGEMDSKAMRERLETERSDLASTVERIKELTGGRGADITLETAGRNDAATWAVLAARRGGTAVCIGGGSPDVSSLSTIDAKTVSPLTFNVELNRD